MKTFIKIKFELNLQVLIKRDKKILNISKLTLVGRKNFLLEASSNIQS